MAKHGVWNTIPMTRIRLWIGVSAYQRLCLFLIIKLIPILNNLIDDLLTVLLLPEYPCADMLLLSFTKKISADLLLCNKGVSSNNGGGGKHTLEPTYINTAFDVLGRTAASAAGHLLYHREHPFQLPHAVDENNVKHDAAPNSDKDEKVRCFCGRKNLNDVFLFDCDRCH
ncbi:MAG: hypothetical protein ACREBR_03165 [bacterium]